MHNCISVYVLCKCLALKTCRLTGTGEEAIVQPNRTPSKRLREEIKSHRQELDALRQSDPTFYKFLQDTDAELLDFDDNDGGAEPGSGAESDEVEAADGQELLDAVEVCDMTPIATTLRKVLNSVIFSGCVNRSVLPCAVSVHAHLACTTFAS